MTLLSSDPARLPTVAPDALDGSPQPAVAAVGVSVRRGGRELLHDADFSVHAGELVAIAGASGAGKTTLLRVLAALERPTEGAVVYGRDRDELTARAAVGFVPQDDIVHRDLSVRATLRYAAALRLPAGTSPETRGAVVDELLRELGLAGRADVRVGALSGGQRKRVSIAVELLRRPDVLLLDEPTSGLDPATAADVMGVLRVIADSGVAVVVTTHREADLERCDRLVFLGSSGRVVVDGELSSVLRHLGETRVADLYTRLGNATEPLALGPPGALRTPARVNVARPTRRVERPVGRWRQATILARRNGEVMARNRLTLAVLLGSPLLVTAMMATLFGRSSFDRDASGGLGAVQVAFWLAFAGFFFGLTYGLLQVVGERAVLERERFAGLSVSAYLLGKVLVLAPLLSAVTATLLGTLRLLDRLPAVTWSTMASLLVTLTLESVAALALGLVTSAAVRDAAQATLALPMLCFPQVLFAGAVVPVVAMPAAGRLLSTVLVNRWAFEALGRTLGLSRLPAGAEHGAAFSGSGPVIWLVLAAAALVLSALAAAVIRRTTPSARG